MFETFAALGTLSCIGIFVLLFMLDRSARQDEAREARQAAAGNDTVRPKDSRDRPPHR
jgi:hypothetical protein